MTDIDATLKERGERYGEFPEHARITQAIKAAMVDSPNWKTLAADQKEALEMIAHKVGRILNGDPDYHGSWHDIVGYTKLVADRLELKLKPKLDDGWVVRDGITHPKLAPDDRVLVTFDNGLKAATSSRVSDLAWDVTGPCRITAYKVIKP